MQFGSALGTACVTFVITNIDDLFVLVTFFTEATTSQSLTPLKITIGQYVGFTVIMVFSMIGFGASVALPSEPIGFLGLLPILLGVWKFLGLFLRTKQEESQNAASESIKSVLKVASITIMNGGDNIGTYIPLFSQAEGAEIAVYVITYYVLLGVLCLIAFLIMKQKHILRVFQKYADYLIPLLYTGLGVFIIVESECYPWVIEHINDRYLADPGRAIISVTTTLFLLICITGLVLLRLRKRKAPPAPDVDIPLENSPSSPLKDATENQDPQATAPIENSDPDAISRIYGPEPRREAAVAGPNNV